MALNGDILGDLMRAAIDATTDKTDRVALFRAMGAAVVSHIQTAGVVTVAGTATGVTAGPAAVPCTAVGTVT